MICERCGKKFFKKDAADEFDSYFNYDLSYHYEIDKRLCGSCAINLIENQQMDITNEGGSDIPIGCLACGGNYPECADSCPLIDE